ncbi:MAG: hypothetical protein QNJ41_00740 [Xenococcaceae cyanobacterium MO_188.B32]|nr:hypothetical protein [Xenococcaceae cyanobacterium MO_188.B32]
MRVTPHQGERENRSQGEVEQVNQYIPQKNGKLRPLSMPSWSDKLLQEVIRSILEAYYEPQYGYK